MGGDILYNNSRENKLYEYVTTTHMLCIIISVCALILSNNSVTKNYYPLFNLKFFALICLIGFAACLLYNSKKILLSKYYKSFALADLVYIIVSFLVVLSTLFITGNSVSYVHAIFILPVIITASSMGMAAGILVATAGTVILVVESMATGGSLAVTSAIESRLILIMIMYVVGWFIGGLRDIEAQHREQLSANLKKLKEEICRREQAEREFLKMSRALEQSPSIAVITDIEGNIEYVNRKFTEVTGYLPVEITGKNIFRQQYEQSPEECKRVLEIINSGKEWKEELLNKKKNGEYYWENASVSPFRNYDGTITHLIIMAEDITGRKKVEKEMARLDQLNLVGEMAASIAHEIRNPMTTIRGFLQLLEGKNDCVQYREFYNLMIEELDRANSIISEFLNVARNKVVEKKAQNLSQIINTLYPLIEADIIKTDNRIKLELKDVPDLLLDEKEIRQLILNLVRNGIDAMHPGGEMTIRTFLEGNEVVLSVQDQGKGIEPDVLEKIGTPFFTTKDTGTGLGLAICYSIAARHNACVKVETGPAGTTFYIRFKHSGG